MVLTTRLYVLVLEWKGIAILFAFIDHVWSKMSNSNTCTVQVHLPLKVFARPFLYER